MKIVIDAGHGGKRTGAITADGRMEKDFSLAVALAMKPVLEYVGFDCFLTRSTDEELGDTFRKDLRFRTDFANNLEADYFVSIHADSLPEDAPHREQVSGSTVYYYPESFRGLRFASMISTALRVHFPNVPHRPMKAESFFVLKHTLMPAVLVECGYLCNPEEADYLFKHINDYAKAIADGIIVFIKTEKRAVNSKSQGFTQS